MAKKFVKISLATKLRVVFGASILGIIAAALVVPWYFVERMAEQGVEPNASEITRMSLAEWTRMHPQGPNSPGSLATYYSSGGEMDGRKGPLFVKVKPNDPAFHGTLKQAIAAFQRNSGRELAIYSEDDDQGRSVYRCFRAVRVEPTCMKCHGSTAPLSRQYEPAQLVGMIDLSIPESAVSPALAWWTRGAFVVGGALATFLAVILFAIITQRLILRPVRHLRKVADKVTEGDLEVRSTIQTGDELQRLGESFNEMLEAIAQQHEKLRSANRALDLKLAELSEANVALFQANKVKNEFLANVSHELRTPLNSIIGFADLLLDGDDERIRRYGQNISASAKSLLGMINDLLDIAKIEAGRTEVRMDRVSVLDACQTLLALLQPLAEKKQLSLAGKLDAELPIVTTDGSKLQQILFNLLSNAIKFTPAGGEVTLLAGVNGKDDGNPEVFVSVADTGPGIAESEQAHIFEKFYQADRTLTKEAGGTGLGLAIARELTNLLGGRLSLKSEPGHGAVFTLHIPVEPKQAT